MKKTLAAAVLALLSTGAIAQTTQGTVAVGGSVGFGTKTRNDEPHTRDVKNIYRSFLINPSVGYFVRDGLELGVSVGLSQSSYKQKNVENANYGSNNNLDLDVYARKYMALTGQLYLHGTGLAGVGFGNSKSKGFGDSSAKVRSTSNSYSIGISPGLTYFATPRLGFTATFGSLSFTSSKTTPKVIVESPSIINSFTADLSPGSVSIGFGYFIAR